MVDLCRQLCARRFALHGGGLPFGNHALNGRGDGALWHAQAFDTDLHQFNAIGVAHLLGQAFGQSLFQRIEANAFCIGIDQLIQCKTTGFGFQGRAKEGAQLTCGFIRVTAHGAQMCKNYLLISGDSPSDKSRQLNTQTILGADIVQTGGGGMQA